jgi:hypothetical protein
MMAPMMLIGAKEGMREETAPNATKRLGTEIVATTEIKNRCKKWNFRSNDGNNAP